MPCGSRSPQDARSTELPCLPVTWFGSFVLGKPVWPWGAWSGRIPGFLQARFLRSEQAPGLLLLTQSEKVGHSAWVPSSSGSVTLKALPGLSGPWGSGDGGSVSPWALLLWVQFPGDKGAGLGELAHGLGGDRYSAPGVLLGAGQSPRELWVVLASNL